MLAVCYKDSDLFFENSLAAFEDKYDKHAISMCGKTNTKEHKEITKEHHPWMVV